MRARSVSCLGTYITLYLHICFLINCIFSYKCKACNPLCVSMLYILVSKKLPINHQKIQQTRIEIIWVIFSPSNDSELLKKEFLLCLLCVKRNENIVLKEIKIISIIHCCLKKRRGKKKKLRMVLGYPKMNIKEFLFCFCKELVRWARGHCIWYLVFIPFLKEGCGNAKESSK